MGRFLIMATAIVLSLCGDAGDVMATEVTARQRYPWNGLVDIAITVMGGSNDVVNSDWGFYATNNTSQTLINVTCLNRVGIDSVSETKWICKYLWNATADVGEVKIEDVKFVVMPKTDFGGVQLWENGPYWAECNIGAQNPEEYGYYFWWGDTIGYKRFGGTWDSNYYSDVKWISSSGICMSGSPFNYSSCPTCEKSFADLQTLGYVDSTGNLVSAHDAAIAHKGHPWRIPSDAEFSALISNCTTKWIVRKGIYGRLVTGKGSFASKSIFLPSAGICLDSELYRPGTDGAYWTSTSSQYNSDDAMDLFFNEETFHRNSGMDCRCYGHSVRSVRNAPIASPIGVATHFTLDCSAETRVAAILEQIAFSPSWETSATNAVAIVSINGDMVTNATVSGTYVWSPKQDGIYRLTHSTFIDGSPVGDTLSATFNVNGLNPIIEPANGTIFDSSLTINISCATDGSIIHFTTNGTTPTLESPIYKRFKISNRTTVKAIAFLPNGSATGVTTAEYAKGSFAAPVITPVDKSFFQHSNQVVSIVREGTDGILRYTTDGSEPMANSTVYVEPFTIHETTTIKAKIFGKEFFDSDDSTAVLTREWVPVAAPVITPSDGSTFQHAGQQVTIALTGSEGTIRYTLDGSEPNEESDTYMESFTINETTTVKAKVFADDFLPSTSVVAVLTREWLSVPAPVITVPESFSGTKTKASISCTQDDAVIRYTTDGSDPNFDSAVYENPFSVTNSCTIKAKAFKSDCLDSDVVSVAVTRVWSIGDALNDPDRLFTTDAQRGWVRDVTVSHDGMESMRSGTLPNSTTYGTYVSSSMSTTVSGKGNLRFWWKASCEDDVEWDHGEFVVDGQTSYIYGETGWREVTYQFDTEGDHTIVWKYKKDSFGSEGSDCIWVDQFHWTPASTSTTTVPVPGAWIDRYYPGTLDHEATAKSKSGKRDGSGRELTVEDEYIAGTNPTNETSKLQVFVDMSCGFPKVTWDPDLNEDGTKTIRTYKVWGKETLDDTSDWEYPTNSLHHFFKVTVEMP